LLESPLNRGTQGSRHPGDRKDAPPPYELVAIPISLSSGENQPRAFRPLSRRNIAQPAGSELTEQDGCPLRHAKDTVEEIPVFHSFFAITSPALVSVLNARAMRCLMSAVCWLRPAPRM
jgi:hypothetical protein